jgi:anti-anti-sigma factor
MSARGRRRTDVRHDAAGGPSYGAGAVTEDRPRAFEVVSADLRGAPGIAVRGEVDVAVVKDLELAIEAAIRDSVGAFVLDLCDVESLDSSGLGVLLRARALLGREDRAVAIVCPPGPVRRLFEVAGIADLLFLYSTREEAAAALVPVD